MEHETGLLKGHYCSIISHCICSTQRDVPLLQCTPVSTLVTFTRVRSHEKNCVFNCRQNRENPGKRVDFPGRWSPHSPLPHRRSPSPLTAALGECRPAQEIFCRRGRLGSNALSFLSPVHAAAGWAFRGNGLSTGASVAALAPISRVVKSRVDVSLARRAS